VKSHLTNAGFGVIDYLSYPVGMLLVAPVVLHRIGVAEYGVWMIATSVISAGSMIAAGFGDACVQRVAQLRATGELSNAPDAVKSILAINALLGTTLACAAWASAPYAATRIAASATVSVGECIGALRIASVLILVRAVESALVGVQRAFEQYRSTVQISTAVRIVTLFAAAVLAWFGFRNVAILSATAVVMIAGVLLQYREARRLLGQVHLRPSFSSVEARALFRRGFFTWLQTLGGVVSGQLDRILLGTYLGAVAVAPYSLCVQFSHPLYGLTGSALNFLFPYLCRRAVDQPPQILRRTLLKAFAANALLVAVPSALLLMLGEKLIALWGGAALAQSAAPILPPIVIASAFVGLSVTGIYAMQALGLFKQVAYINLAGRAVALFAMIALLRQYGVAGLAVARLSYGCFALMVYAPLIQTVNSSRDVLHQASASMVPCEIQEGSQP